MKALKVVVAILGVLLIAGGIWCAMTPGATYLSLAWIIAVCMVVDGAGALLSYFDERKQGYSDAWTLLAAVVSLLLGVAILVSEGMRVTFDLMITYMVAAWFTFGGIMRVVAAVKLRGFHKAHPKSAIGAHWVFPLIAGVLLAVCGVYGFFHPILLAMTLGIFIGISIAVVGCNLLAFACASLGDTTQVEKN